MKFFRRIKGNGYVLGISIITLALLFSTNLSVTGRSQPQEGISQPQAFSTGGTMNFQGQLTDMGGNPLNGSYNMRFAIYDATSAGTKKWPGSEYEQHTGVVVNQGLFSVQLGSKGSAITPIVFNEGGDRYLQIWVCNTAGTGCSIYDDMGRLEISSSAIAQHLQAPVVLEGNGYDTVLTAIAEEGYGVFGWVTSTKVNISPGVHGRSDSPYGYGVYGLATNTATNATNYGVFGESNNPSGRGVYGSATSTWGNNSGVMGYSKSTGGRGVYGLSEATSFGIGVLGSSSGEDGAGVLGHSFSNSGIGAGVRGFSSSTTGRGVYGEASATSGINYGIYGLSESTSGVGVFGRAIATTGTHYGVYGRVDSTTGFAGYFLGRVHVNGTLSKAAGSFKIDHPLDPENKYLYHSFVESPDMKNIYDGVVVLDENGEAQVTMPDWFEALNQEFRYQLTPIGGWAPLYISQEIIGNSFRISGGEPGMKISWQVTGIRYDPYAVQNRIPVEEDKPESERGTLLYPQGYGLPQEFGVDYNPELLAEMENPVFTD